MRVTTVIRLLLSDWNNKVSKFMNTLVTFNRYVVRRCSNLRTLVIPEAIVNFWPKMAPHP